MKPFGPVALLDEKESRALWASVRQVKPFAAEAARARPLWRISTAPAQRPRDRRGDHAGGADVLRLGRRSALGGDAVCRRAGRRGDPRARSPSVGGHATLVRAPAAVRASVDVFEPQEPALRALNKRVKDGFDPKGVLNPGRMWAGV